MENIKLHFFCWLVLGCCFSVSIQAQVAPGGVTSGLDQWLKANAGVVGTTPITGWTDQSATPLNPSVNGDPNLKNVNPIYFNYNPSIEMDGTGDYFSWSGLTAGYAQGEAFSLHKLNEFPATASRELWDFDANNVGNNHPYQPNGTWYDDFGVNTTGVITVGDISTFVTPTYQYIYNSNVQSSGLRSNYVQGRFTASSNSSVGFVNNPTYGKGDWSSSSEFLGDFGEFILYGRSLSSTERVKIWSYLAIKYGVTLDISAGGTAGDYHATDNTQLWDASLNVGYHNDVIGIGRDDDEALYQKQSHTFNDTSRIYLNSIATTNSANTGTFSSNISYLVMGHNQGVMHAIPAATAEVPTGLMGCAIVHRIEREWKVTKTNVSEDFNWDVSLNNPATNPGSVNVAHLRLLVDDDGDFSNGGTSCYYNGDGTGLTISYTNPVITFSGISTTHIPNNSKRYMTIASVNSLTPLPIEITGFKATCNDGIPNLTWTTTAEINNDYFTIERSDDAVNFDVIETIPGGGNTSSPIQYSWMDDSPIAAWSYYRLKQTDFNGDDEVLGIKVVKCIDKEDVFIYPNPFTNSITIGLDKIKSYPIWISLYNAIGQRVYSKMVNEKQPVLNINFDKQLPSGTYFLEVKNPRQSNNERIIKIK